MILFTEQLNLDIFANSFWRRYPRMTNRTKIILLSAFLLAFLAVVGSSGALGPELPAKTQVYAYSFLISVDILAAPFVYWLRLRRRGHEKLLEPDFSAKYKTIKDTVDQAALPDQARQEITDAALDLLLAAQKAGRPADLAVPDTDGLAAAFIRACDNRRMFWLSQLPSRCLYFICFILSGQLLRWFENTRQDLLAIHQDYLQLLFFLLLAFVLLPLLQSDRMQAKDWLYLVPVGGGVLYVLAATSLRAFAANVPIIQTVALGSVNIIPSRMVLFLLLALIPLLLLLRLGLTARPAPIQSQPQAPDNSAN
jgi:hypothetical protein